MSSRGGIVCDSQFLIVSALLPSLAQAQSQVPVGEIVKDGSSVKFSVKASVAIDGTFDKRDATLTFGSRGVESGVLDVKIQADGVNTGSGMKGGELKGKDFFDAQHDPLITFHSTNVVQTSPNTIDINGDFTIRGVTKREKLTLSFTCKGTGAGVINGTMAFDRKDYGTNSGTRICHF